MNKSCTINKVHQWWVECSLNFMIIDVIYLLLLQINLWIFKVRYFKKYINNDKYRGRFSINKKKAVYYCSNQTCFIKSNKGKNETWNTRGRTVTSTRVLCKVTGRKRAGPSSLDIVSFSSWNAANYSWNDVTNKAAVLTAAYFSTTKIYI